MFHWKRFIIVNRGTRYPKQLNLDWWWHSILKPALNVCHFNTVLSSDWQEIVATWPCSSCIDIPFFSSFGMKRILFVHKSCSILKAGRCSHTELLSWPAYNEVKKNAVLFKEPNSSTFQLFDTDNQFELWDNLCYIWECKIALWPTYFNIPSYESEWSVEGASFCIGGCFFLQKRRLVLCIECFSIWLGHCQHNIHKFVSLLYYNFKDRSLLTPAPI